MIQDIKNFDKKSKRNQIKNFLDSKYKTDIPYLLLYQEFRKIFPFLGSEDAQIFLQYLSKSGCEYKKVIDNDSSCSKIFFSSELMKDHYENYGDILLIDATYKGNKYSLAIVVLSGFTNSGRNCLFGVAIVNDETEDTYSWLLRNFFELKTKFPRIIITDQNPSITTVIEKEYLKAKKVNYHFHCSWHLKQNLKRNCSYLSAMKLGDVKDRIFKLPDIRSQDEFEEEIKQII